MSCKLMKCMYNACMGISKREFVNMWNDLCINTFGAMSDDLPDIMCTGEVKEVAA